MTDLAGSPQRASAEPELGKRGRLVAATRRVLHEQGVERTTLADIAQAADVPVGNVYYYFKTKDELVAAAIDDHAEDIQRTLASLDRHRSPKARRKGVSAPNSTNATTVWTARVRN
jgi:TetR/AcrR family transcriptional regulator, transcriptional repressor for nem operon